MQLKVAKMLNRIMLGAFVVLIGLGLLLFFLAERFPDMRLAFIAGFLLAALIIFFGFRWLETRWEKTITTRMARSGSIALAHIKSGKRLISMRDSGFTKYWLYEFEGDIYDSKQNRIPKTFYEKMAYETEEIPEGWLYVTYDESKPNQIYIIPNIMISHIPTLEPIIRKYEGNKRLKIKYLDVFYKRGVVLRTYREALKQSEATLEQSI